MSHGLIFTIQGATVTVDEMAQGVVDQCIGMGVPSEHQQEMLVHDITHAIINTVAGKVRMADKNGRASWIERHPPNHAGFYFCHLCGGWVHVSQAELDHIEPRSVLRGEDPDRDENRRMSHAWPVIAPDGTVVCPGNRGKGSRNLPSVTMEIAPPDGEI